MKKGRTKKEKEQIEIFKKESWNYFRRNFKGTDLRTMPLNSHIEQIFSSYPISIRGGSILDLGCGAGNNLHCLHKRFRTKRGVGVESSAKVVKLLSGLFPEFEFYENDCRSLPFAAGDFDLVILRSVLHWVDRNYLMQTIGEAVRVSAKYLLVSDFAPTRPYSVIYHHDGRCRTFKMSYQALIEGTGFMRCVASVYSRADDEWKAVQTTLFEKLAFEKAYPLRKESDFKSS